MMIRYLLPLVLGLLFVGKARADFVVCVMNKTHDVHDVIFADENGQRIDVRANGQSTECADVGEKWRQFHADVRDAHDDSCRSGFWPNHWLLLEGDGSELRCSKHLDTPSKKKHLGDYSVRLNITNGYSKELPISLDAGNTICGYLEWLPMTVKPGETKDLPARFVTSGSCAVIPSLINFDVGPFAGDLLSILIGAGPVCHEHPVKVADFPGYITKCTGTGTSNFQIIKL
jgi:hypothetical protein